MAREESQPLPSKDNAWREELAEEIADHLTQSARDGEISGQSPQAAEADALRRFGSVEKTYFHCWWIHQKEQIMFSTLRNSFLIAGFLVLGLLAYFGWTSQQRLATRLEDVSETLQAVAEAQQRLAAQQNVARPETAPAPTTVSIEGYAYLGTKDRPAKEFSLTVVSASGSGRKINRVLTTDDAGRFESGDLPPDEYQVVFTPANLDGEQTGDYLFYSSAYPLYQSGRTEAVAFDVLLLKAKVTVQFVPALPLATKYGGNPLTGVDGKVLDVETKVVGGVALPALRKSYIDSQSLTDLSRDFKRVSQSSRAPLILSGGELNGTQIFGSVGSQTRVPEARKLPTTAFLPPGKHLAIVAIYFAHEYLAPGMPRSSPRESLGRQDLLPSVPLTTFEVSPGSETRLEVHWPGQDGFTYVNGMLRELTAEDFELKVITTKKGETP